MEKQGKKSPAVVHKLFWLSQPEAESWHQLPTSPSTFQITPPGLTPSFSLLCTLLLLVSQSLEGPGFALRCPSRALHLLCQFWDITSMHPINLMKLLQPDLSFCTPQPHPLLFPQQRLKVTSAFFKGEVGSKGTCKAVICAEGRGHSQFCL